MKKIFITCFIYVIYIQSSFSQNGNNRNCSDFLKRVEYNFEQFGNYRYNLKSKSDLEKLFFGDVNADVEFYYMPSAEAAFKSPPSGFRILKDSIDRSYILEIKYISNYREANEETLILYKFETLSFHVSNWFAEKLYDLMVFFIGNFKAKGVEREPNIFYIRTGHGYSVTFRTVVDDEVWTLWIEEPWENASKKAKLFRTIIEDAIENIFDESKYLYFF